MAIHFTLLRCRVPCTTSSSTTTTTTTTTTPKSSRKQRRSGGEYAPAQVIKCKGKPISHPLPLREPPFAPAALTSVGDEKQALLAAKRQVRENITRRREAFRIPTGDRDTRVLSWLLKTQAEAGRGPEPRQSRASLLLLPPTTFKPSEQEEDERPEAGEGEGKAEGEDEELAVPPSPFLRSANPEPPCPDCQRLFERCSECYTQGQALCAGNPCDECRLGGRCRATAVPAPTTTTISGGGGGVAAAAPWSHEQTLQMLECRDGVTRDEAVRNAGRQLEGEEREGTEWFFYQVGQARRVPILKGTATLVEVQ